MTETRTERLNVFARDLRRGDRIRNLTGASVTAFDLDVDQAADTVAIFPRQADLDAGADRRYDVDGGETLIVERETELDGTPVHAAAPTEPIEATLARADVATLEAAAARLSLATLTATFGGPAARRLELIEAELARRAELAAEIAAAERVHIIGREERDDAVRMVCATCGKRSRWGTYRQLSAAADRHADDVARGR